MLLNQMRFLVVDDMMTMRKIVIKELRARGVTDITEADNGASAWEKVKEARNEGKPFHMVISDWNMPQMKGVELLRKCRSLAEMQSAGFLLVTAESDAGQVSEAIADGVDNYLVKPFDTAKFTEKFNSVLKKRFGI